jgi:hypothetical protein
MSEMFLPCRRRRPNKHTSDHANDDHWTAGGSGTHDARRGRPAKRKVKPLQPAPRLTSIPTFLLRPVRFNPSLGSKLFGVLPIGLLLSMDDIRRTPHARAPRYKLAAEQHAFFRDDPRQFHRDRRVETERLFDTSLEIWQLSGFRVRNRGRQGPILKSVVDLACTSSSRFSTKHSNPQTRHIAYDPDRLTSFCSLAYTSGCPVKNANNEAVATAVVSDPAATTDVAVNNTSVCE